MKHFVMRLNDGETWTNLEGCTLLMFDKEPTDEMVKNPMEADVVARFFDGEIGRVETVFLAKTPTGPPIAVSRVHG